MNSWDDLKNFTTARVGLGRTGSSLPTRRVLEFQRAHAAARSAVWSPWSPENLQQELLNNSGDTAILATTQVTDRETYLRFPDRGRRLNGETKNSLLSQTKTNIAFVVSDGLSALALQNHFMPFWNDFRQEFKISFPELSYQLVLVPFGRVAVSDPIGECLGAQLSVIFIGERPGLNSPDSLGIYMTFNPVSGKSDAQRNCISNVRSPHGLRYRHATQKLIYLMKESLRLQLSGVNLKDNLILQTTARESLP